MGDVTYKQTLTIIAGKTPSPLAAKIQEIDFQLDTGEIIISDLNESTHHRFKVENGSTDQSICQGTISEFNVFVITPAADIEIKLVNSNGTSMPMTLLAERTTIIHSPLLDILVTNNTGVPIKGIVFYAGD